MIFGSPRSSAPPRAQFIDLNLVPPEYRRREFPYVTAGLALLLVGLLVLLYSLLYAKTYGDYEIQALSTRVAEGQAVVQTATGDPAALARREQLRAMRDDYQALKPRQVAWGDVFQVIAAAPPGIIVRDVSQSGFGVTITGSAQSQSAAARYLDQLRGSDLFVNATLQVNPSSAPFPTTASIQPTPPVPPAAPPGLAPVNPTSAPPTTAPIQPAQPPSAPPSNPPPVRPTQPPAIVPPTLPPATATPRPSITATGTVTPTLTPPTSPTPAFAWVLRSSQQVPASSANAAVSDIKGTVVDLNNQPVAGITLEIDSEAGGWSAQTTSRSDGSFDFSVTHGKFQVYVVGDGSSQIAVDLYTGADGVPGVYGYLLTFQKTFSGLTPPANLGTSVPTLTPSLTPSPSPSPISLGSNIASLGCASAYQAVNGVAKALPGGANSPNLAIDGDLNTAWNAQMSPSSGTQVIWAWQLPEPGQSIQPLFGPRCSAAGLNDNQVQINGFQLIPDQNPAGLTDHELWLYADTACTQNINTSNSAYISWNQSTSAGQILPLTISPPAIVRCVIVRTLVDPSYVAWKEVQIYQAVPAPFGFPSMTPTASFTTSPTPIGSFTATPTISPTPTITPTVTITPTTTISPTITGTSTPPLTPYPGLDVAQYATVSTGGPRISCVSDPPITPGPSSDPCAVVDGNTDTYWKPTNQPNSVQGVQIYLPDISQTIVDIRVLLQSPNGVTDESVQVQITGNSNGAPSFQTLSCSPLPPANGYNDRQEVDCPIPSPTPGVVALAVVQLIQDPLIGPSSPTYGIREVFVYAQVNGIPCSPTCTPTPTFTVTLTPTPSFTSTPTPTPCSPTCTPTPTSTITLTPPPTFTPTASPTYTLTVTSTISPTPTLSPTPTPTPTPAGVPPSPRQPSTSSGPISALRSFLGLGRGPGLEAGVATASAGAPVAPQTAGGYVPPAGAASSGNPANPGASTAVPPASASAGGPVDFTIILEVGSGKGY